MENKQIVLNNYQMVGLAEENRLHRVETDDHLVLVETSVLYYHLWNRTTWSSNDLATQCHN